MESISGRRRKWKKKVTHRRKALEDMMKLSGIDDIDIKVSMSQTLTPLGLEAVNENLQKEVRPSLCRYLNLNLLKRQEVAPLSQCPQ